MPFCGRQYHVIYLCMALKPAGLYTRKRNRYSNTSEILSIDFKLQIARVKQVAKTTANHIQVYFIKLNCNCACPKVRVWNRGPPGCITRPATIFKSCVCTIKLTQ